MMSSQSNLPESCEHGKNDRIKRISAIVADIFNIDPELRCVVVEAYRNDEWEMLSQRLIDSIRKMDRLRYFNVQDHLQKLGYIPRVNQRDLEMRATRLAHYFRNVLTLISDELPVLLE